MAKPSLPDSKNFRITLTDKIIEAIEAWPDGSRRMIRDTSPPELGIRVSPTGGKSFVVAKRTGPRVLWITLGAYPEISLAEARRRAHTAIVNIRAGKPPRPKTQAQKAAEVLKKGTVLDAFEMYCREVLPTKATGHAIKVALSKDMIPAIGNMHPQDVRPEDIRFVLEVMMRRGATVHANRILAMTRAFLNWCRYDKRIIVGNPAAELRKPVKEKSRDRVLDDWELRAIWQATEAIGNPYRDVYRLLMLTGQRKSEVAEAEWEEFDFDRRLWTIPGRRVKNEDEHIVHLSAPVLEILGALPRFSLNGAACPWLFTLTGKGPIDGFSKAKVRLDQEIEKVLDGRPMAHWVPHDLRRTMATRLAEMDEPINVVDRILNHRAASSIRGVAAVYQRAQFTRQRAAALDKWGQYVSALMGGTPGANIVELRRPRG